MSGWIGVDLDGTLAVYPCDGGIGEPVPAMKDRVIAWLGRGIEVRIVTARATLGLEEVKRVHDWLEEWGLPRLRVTCCKDFEMIELWDDRAIQVETNTGRRIGP